MSTRADILEAHVTELQAAATAAVETQPHRRVREFFALAGQPLRDRPGVPEDERVRFHLRLVAEEFFELLDAALARRLPELDSVAPEDGVRAQIATAPLKVDLPELADALADLDYVVEGMRQAFGIHGPPIATAVHRANMAKRGGPKDADGKQKKPAGWQPPDVRGELIKQGWRPE